MSEISSRRWKQILEFLEGTQGATFLPEDELNSAVMSFLGAPEHDWQKIKFLFSSELFADRHLRVEPLCLCCGKAVWKEWTVEHILAYLSCLRKTSGTAVESLSLASALGAKVDFFCQKCKTRVFPYLEATTNRFLNLFLSKAETATHRDWFFMKRLYEYADKDRIAADINAMDYSDFLQTKLWKTVAWRVKKRFEERCALCGESYGLSVHHRSYEHRGYEPEFWKEDLICLCKSCHEQFHEVLGKKCQGRHLTTAGKQPLMDSVRAHLSESEWKTAGEIARALGLEAGDVRKVLRALIWRGEVTQQGWRYQLLPKDVPF